MVSRFLVSTLLVLTSVVCMAQTSVQSTRELIDTWKSDTSFKHLMAFTFKQETIRFKDSLSSDTSTWYEAIQFPDKFRIDFGLKTENSNLYRHDSLYVLRKGEVVHKDEQIQDFMIMSGGFYYYNTSVAIKKLQLSGIDTKQFSKSKYKEREVYVIGGDGVNLNSAQIWVDVERRVVLRQVLKGNDSQFTEVRFELFKKIDGHWIESWLEFYREGRLIQTERYYDIQVHPKLNPGIFSPSRFSKIYWY